MDWLTTCHDFTSHGSFQSDIPLAMRSPPLTCISFSSFLSSFVVFFCFCFCFCFLFVCLFVRYIRMLRLSLSKILRTYEEHTQTERYFDFFFFFCVNSNWKYNKNVELWSNSTINPNTTNTKIYIFLTLKMRFLIARYTEEQFSLLFTGHFWMDLLKYYTTLLKEHAKNVYRLKSQRKTVQPQSQNQCHLVLKSITENLRYETLNFRKHLPGYSWAVGTIENIILPD